MKYFKFPDAKMIRLLVLLLLGIMISYSLCPTYEPNKTGYKSKRQRFCSRPLYISLAFYAIFFVVVIMGINK